MKALDDNIEKDKPDSASDTENASETENVSMDTNSDHDYSPPVSGTQKKFPLTPPRVAQKNTFFEKSKSLSNLLILRVKISQIIFFGIFGPP